MWMDGNMTTCDENVTIFKIINMINIDSLEDIVLELQFIIYFFI